MNTVPVLYILRLLIHCHHKAVEAGTNKVAIKRIMGHVSIDITDKVYTHKDVSELLKAIDGI
jgi:integrase